MKETTTLYSVLHGGDDDTAPIVGAGIIILGAAAIADMMHNIKVFECQVSL